METTDIFLKKNLLRSIKRSLISNFEQPNIEEAALFLGVSTSTIKKLLDAKITTRSIALAAKKVPFKNKDCLFYAKNREAFIENLSKIKKTTTAFYSENQKEIDSIYFKANTLRTVRRYLISNPNPISILSSAKLLKVTKETVKKLYSVKISVKAIQLASQNVPFKDKDAFLFEGNRTAFIMNLASLGDSQC